MYNLFRFIVRYHLLLMFVLLELFCFFLIYRNNTYSRTAYNNVANNVSGKAYTLYDGVTGYFYLRQVNDSLAAENASLRAQILESQFDNRVDSGTVSDTSKRFVQQYNYLTARVIYNSVNRPTNFIYLDKGSRHGIQKQMGVISPSGIVGQVVSVTENFSAVMSVLSKDFKVSAKFQKNEYFGNLHWTGNNTRVAALEEIPKHVPAKVGDTIVTSGYSQLYPRNVMVGTVRSISSKPENNFLDITINLSTDFGNLSHVYVVRNIFKNQLQQIDSAAAKKTTP